MKLGVMGAGAVGCYLGGRLIAAGSEVVLVGRAALVDEVARHGMQLTDYHGAAVQLAPTQVRIVESAGALADCDVVLLTVKSGDTADSASTLARVLRPDALVVELPERRRQRGDRARREASRGRGHGAVQRAA